jgi:hypothetical protein
VQNVRGRHQYRELDSEFRLTRQVVNLVQNQVTTVARPDRSRWWIAFLPAGGVTQIRVDVSPPDSQIGILLPPDRLVEFWAGRHPIWVTSEWYAFTSAFGARLIVWEIVGV